MVKGEKKGSFIQIMLWERSIMPSIWSHRNQTRSFSSQNILWMCSTCNLAKSVKPANGIAEPKSTNNFKTFFIVNQSLSELSVTHPPALPPDYTYSSTHLSILDLMFLSKRSNSTSFFKLIKNVLKHQSHEFKAIILSTKMRSEAVSICRAAKNFRSVSEKFRCRRNADSKKSLCKYAYFNHGETKECGPAGAPLLSIVAFCILFVQNNHLRQNANKS